jgi:ribonuclease R
MPLYEKPKKHSQIPSKEEVVAYLKSLDHLPDKRELCRHFHIKGGPGKIAIKSLLKELKKEGLYSSAPECVLNPLPTDPFKQDGEGKEGDSCIGQISKTSDGLRLIPTFKKNKQIFEIQGANHLKEDVVGKVFRAKVLGTHPPRVELVEEIGTTDKISLISAHMAGLPMVFPEAVLKSCQNLKVPALEDRVDVRSIPLVTIDGPDSRDFDDAVWAEPDLDPNNVGGWHLIVSIADVAYYAPSESPVDVEALNRGTSTYFPDYVIPMLPEELSNNLCSLRPGEDRACVAVHLWIDSEGQKIRHQFFRGLMRSAARLTYEQAQRIHEGQSSEEIDKKTIDYLYNAYYALERARKKRGTLEVDTLDPQVILGCNGAIQDFVIKARLDSHRLIEEFMILANVAAAEFLEKNKMPTLYRVHDKPDLEKIQELRRTLASLKIKYSGPLQNPGDFSALLESVVDSPYKNVINELVLRCQSQAVYSPQNTGHFGLNLTHYSHFTSPIRRYPDLLVHRGILSLLGYKDGLSEHSAQDMTFLGRDTSHKERRAEGAERDAMDRYMAQYLAPRVGEYFKVYVSGISKAGLFVTLPDIGASGLVPMNRLGNDFYIYREQPTRLEGRRTKHKFMFGDVLKVKLLDADLVKGRLSFELEPERRQNNHFKHKKKSYFRSK